MTTMTTHPPAPAAAAMAMDGASRKEAYRALCRSETTIPLFARDWWLDAAVGPAGWDVALVSKGEVVLASMPYVLRRRYGLKVITQPALTPALGPWLRQSPGKPATRIGNQKELMQALIDQLPRFDHFTQAWHASVQNWQPFYWNGFQQTTYYTYVLPDLTDTEKLWQNFDSKVRAKIKKASGEYRLQVRDDLPLDDLLALNRKTFARQGMAPPYSDDFVRRLEAACALRGCSKYFIATEPGGAQHAGSFIVWDEHSAYGLISGADPAYRASGANSLCVWAAIQHAARVTRQFDFEGSMIEPVESFFRGFGCTPFTYFHISKTNSRLLQLRKGLLSMMGH